MLSHTVATRGLQLATTASLVFLHTSHGDRTRFQGLSGCAGLYNVNLSGRVHPVTLMQMAGTSCSL
jgi:hypothetical protein